MENIIGGLLPKCNNQLSVTKTRGNVTREQEQIWAEQLAACLSRHKQKKYSRPTSFKTYPLACTCVSRLAVDFFGEFRVKAIETEFSEPLKKESVSVQSCQSYKVKKDDFYRVDKETGELKARELRIKYGVARFDDYHPTADIE